VIDTVYILALDSTELKPDKKIVSYQDKTAICELPLQVVLEKVPVSLLVVVVPETLELKGVKEVRELIRSNLRSEKVQKLIDEVWIELLVVRGKSISYRILSTISLLNSLFSKYEKIGNVLVDTTLLVSDTIRTSLIEGVRLSRELELLGNASIKLLLLEQVRKGIFKLVEQEVERLREGRINTILHVLKLIESASEIEPSDKHRVRLLLGKLQVLLERLKLGLVFEAMSELTELVPVYYRAVREVKDPLVKNILEILPLADYLPERQSSIELARRVIKLLVDLDNIALAVLFLKNFVYTYIHAYCCYCGMLEPEQCSIRAVEKYIHSVDVLSQIDNENFRKLKTIVNILAKTGLTAGLCTGLITENLDNVAQVTCPGTLNRTDTLNTLMSILEELPRLDVYSLCNYIASETRSREE